MDMSHGLLGDGDGLLGSFDVIEQKDHRQSNSYGGNCPERDAPTRFLHVFVHKIPIS